MHKNMHRDEMTKNGTTKYESLLLKGADVLRVFDMGRTAGYRWLKHLEAQNVLIPVRLPGIKTLRWRKDEVEALANNKDEIPCADFQTN